VTTSRFALRGTIACAYVAGAAWYWRRTGPLDSTTSGTALLLTAFLLPTAAAVTLWLLAIIETRDRGADRTVKVRAAVDALRLQFTLFVAALHGVTLLHTDGALWIRPWAPRAIVVLLGAFLVGVGNLLPLTRPNLVIGIRTRRVMSSRNAWLEVHRSAGYALVCLGFAVIFTGAALRRPFGAQLVSAAALTSLAVVAARYRTLVRREIRSK
jgi:immunity protein, SdpI family